MSKVLLVILTIIISWCVLEEIINIIKFIKDEQHKKQNDSD